MQSKRFRDFEAFANAVRDVDCLMTLQNPSQWLWTVHQVYLPEVHIQLGRLGSGNIVEGQSWSDGYLFYLPLTDACEYSANGTVLPTHSFMVLEPGCDFCISTKVAHDWCSVFVPTQKLGRGGDLAEPSSGSETMTCRVTPAIQQFADQFRALLGQIMNAATNCPQFESSPAALRAAEQLVSVACLVVGQRPAGEAHQEGRPQISRQEIIRRAMEWVEERGDEPVRVGELAAAAAVSERTLRTAFNEFYGVGPLRYLQLRQLHQIHRALRLADSETASASDVMVRYGEWEFGRVAQRYRRLFGELPSETLRKKSR